MEEKTWRRVSASVLAAAGMVVAATIATSGSASGAEPIARATLVNQAGDAVGEVTFKGHGSHVNQVQVDIDAPAAPNLGAFHGIHIHTTGVCNPAPSGSTNVPFGSAGGHWNPTGATHGSHVGDLPSVLFTLNGETHATFETERFDISGLLDAGGDGSAVVLHVGPDNFANIPPTYGTPNDNTLNTGDAGGRYACGVVTAN